VTEELEMVDDLMLSEFSGVRQSEFSEHPRAFLSKESCNVELTFDIKFFREAYLNKADIYVETQI
jgi:hypothetical protein